MKTKICNLKTRKRNKIARKCLVHPLGISVRFLEHLQVFPVASGNNCNISSSFENKLKFSYVSGHFLRIICVFPVLLDICQSLLALQGQFQYFYGGFRNMCKLKKVLNVSKRQQVLSVDLSIFPFLVQVLWINYYDTSNAHCFCHKYFTCSFIGNMSKIMSTIT